MVLDKNKNQICMSAMRTSSPVHGKLERKSKMKTEKKKKRSQIFLNFSNNNNRKGKKNSLKEIDMQTSERKWKQIKYDELIHRVGHSSGYTLESPGKLQKE